MINKTIHYVWVGGNPMGELQEKCLASWRKYLPDYEIKCWDESNIDISSNTYMQEAYQAKKWAFVSDYIRVWVLYHYGGIYLDTDTEVLKPFDDFLHLPGVLSFEVDDCLLASVMLVEPHHPFMKRLLDSYGERSFYKEDKLDMTPLPLVLTDLAEEFYPHFKRENTAQDLGDLQILPLEYFCAKDWYDGEMYITQNTYCIQHYAASWVVHKPKWRRWFHIFYWRRKFKKLFK